MSNHRAIQCLFYEYLRDDLPVSDRVNVEIHIASCPECRMELEGMRSTIAILTARATKPSEERPDQFWKELSTSVLQEAAARRLKRQNPLIEMSEWLEESFALHPRYAFATTGMLATLLIVFALWTFNTSGERDAAMKRASVDREHPATPLLSAVTPERVNQYFRKSKTLLVGVANLRTDQTEPVDFSKERRVSRDLIREARYLRQQPIDPRTRRLMDDMERILIELSNVEGHKDPSTMDIIRSGIHHENLLFKIRMAEAMYDSTNYVYASDRR